MRTGRKAASLHERIWEAVRRIPAGRVATYGQIARHLGLGRSARLVGYALHSLPHGMPVPWHRVINARGAISFPPGSPLFARQRELLAREGVPLGSGRIDLARYGWKPRQKDGGQARQKDGPSKSDEASGQARGGQARGGRRPARRRP